jgi:hypothetical protein
MKQATDSRQTDRESTQSSRLIIIIIIIHPSMKIRTQSRRSVPVAARRRRGEQT